MAQNRGDLNGERLMTEVVTKLCKKVKVRLHVAMREGRRCSMGLTTESVTETV